MDRFGSSRQRADLDVLAPVVPVDRDERPVTPLAGETMHEIGVVIALHLVFSFVVVLTLQAFGVS